MITNDKNCKYILMMCNKGGGLKQVLSGRIYEPGTVITSKASTRDRGRNYFVVECINNPDYKEV